MLVGFGRKFSLSISSSFDPTSLLHGAHVAFAVVSAITDNTVSKVFQALRDARKLMVTAYYTGTDAINDIRVSIAFPINVSRQSYSTQRYMLLRQLRIYMYQLKLPPNG